MTHILEWSTCIGMNCYSVFHILKRYICDFNISVAILLHHFVFIEISWLTIFGHEEIVVAIFCCGPMSLCRPCIHSIDNDCTVNCWWLHPWPRSGWWRGCIIKQLPAMRLLQRLMFLPCRWIRKMRTVVVDRTVKFKLFFSSFMFSSVSDDIWQVYHGLYFFLNFSWSFEAL